MKHILLVVAALFAATFVQAQDEAKNFKGETEASVVVVSGNVNNETYGAKTTNTYNLSDLDLVSVYGKYYKTTTGGTETGKYWLAGTRYERVISKDVFNLFIQHQAEHSPYNGIFTQRDSTDVGAKYFFTKTDDLTWIGELGYRYSKTYIDPTTEFSNYARLYTEAAYKFNESTSGKLWVEYLPNLDKADAYLYNAEASISVAMSSILSLKSAFLLNHNEALASPLKKDTTTWTTAIVANY